MRLQIRLLIATLLAGCSATLVPSVSVPPPVTTVHVRVFVLKPAHGRPQISASAHPDPLEEERFDSQGHCVLIVKDAAGHELARRKLGFGSEISDHHRKKMKLIDVSIETPESADSVELIENGKRAGKARIRWKEESPPSAI